ncbi:MAG: SOS response-associated peptidase [Deltaproteobacteria bacterium]|nr:SOS response-associated peptidase [Deltaproteobacteria bacterium]
MCGRFAFYSTIAAINKSINIKVITCSVESSYNIAPLSEVLTVIRDGDLKLGKLKWGFVPSFAKDTKLASKMINARFETISEKPSFKRSYSKKRCIILANGFYEWRKEKDGKQPYYIYIPTREILTFAGIFEIWNKKYKSCAIITKDSSSDISKIHPRMPVVLKENALMDWLDKDITDKDALNEIIQENCEDSFSFHKVSKDVNYTQKNSKKCISVLTESL